MQILDFVDFHNTWLSVSSAEAVEGRDSPGFAGLAATDRSVRISKLDWCNIQNRYVLVQGKAPPGKRTGGSVFREQGEGKAQCLHMCICAHLCLLLYVVFKHGLHVIQ